MKFNRWALLILLVLLLAPASAFAQSVDVVSQSVEVGAGRPWWKKAVRGTARVVTLGAIQAASDSIKKDTPFTFAFDHDGIDTDFYEVYINTALYQTKPISALTNGTVGVSFSSGLPKGSYVFLVKAKGPGGEGVSPTFTLASTAGNPTPPGNPRIIK